MDATVGTPTSPAVANRLARLEALQTRLRRVGIVILILLFLLGQAGVNGVAKVVEAEKFVVRDARAKARAEVAFLGDELSLTLFDKKGDYRGKLTVSAEDVPRLSLYDKDGQQRTLAWLEPQKNPKGDVRGEVRGEVKKKTAGPDLEQTAVLFRRLCSRCHADDGGGARMRARLPNFPDFVDSSWQASRSDAQLIASILHGRGEEMPPFEDQLSPVQARTLTALIRSFDVKGGRRVEVSEEDFASRFKRLQQQWQELEAQIEALSGSARKP